MKYPKLKNFLESSFEFYRAKFTRPVYIVASDDKELFKETLNVFNKEQIFFAGKFLYRLKSNVFRASKEIIHVELLGEI